MPPFYLPSVDPEKLKELASAAGRDEEFLQLLTEPLHEELYRRQTFDLLDELTEGQQLALSYEYVSEQIKGGGVIQLLHNGYAGLVMDLPKFLQALGDAEMSMLMDDTLKFYVQHRGKLDAELTVNDFARLYAELPESEALDARFHVLHANTIKVIAAYAKNNLQEFTK